MTALRQRMIEDMQLRGLAPGTQVSYVGAVRALAEYYGKPPDQVSDEELRQYFVYLTHERKLARSTCTGALCAVKFLYQYTLKRPWPLCDLVRPGRVKQLPVVLDIEEVQAILGQVEQLRYRVCLTLIYACGLRISEGVAIQVTEVDSRRMQLLIRAAKGNKDRSVPLPKPLLPQLRQFWLSHRHPVYVFPKGHWSGIDPRADGPMNPNTVGKAFREARRASGVTKAATVHTLRHSWATHLLEAGVSLPVIQQWMGHASLRSTLLYTHLTQRIEASALDKLSELLAGLL